MNHGKTMTVATLLHIVSIAAVMVPSFAINLSLLANLSNLGVIVTIIHACTGVFSVVSALFLLFLWRLAPPEKMTCYKRKWLIIPTLSTWAITLILGIIFYIYYYV